MQTKSRKAKGRRLQNWLRDLILNLFPELKAEDVKVAVMGESGVDIKFSTYGKEIFNYSCECKNNERFKAIYNAYEQNIGENRLLIIKSNLKRPLAIVDAEHFLKLVQRGR